MAILPPNDRTSPTTPNTKVTIGWLENVILRLKEPDAGGILLELKAKVDTGAYSSSLHAIDIVTFTREDRLHVRFTVPWRGNERQVEAPLFKRGIVKTSEGRREFRYFIETHVHAGPTAHPLLFSLNDRSSMLYPVLLGRNFLRDRYLVDVSRKFLLQPPPSPLQLTPGSTL